MRTFCVFWSLCALLASAQLVWRAHTTRGFDGVPERTIAAGLANDGSRAIGGTDGRARTARNPPAGRRWQPTFGGRRQEGRSKTAKQVELAMGYDRVRQLATRRARQSPRLPVKHRKRREEWAELDRDR